MSLVTTKQILEDAYQNHYAVGAFGTHNMEIMKAVAQGAEDMNSPVIFQTTPGTIKYLGIDHVVAMARIVAQQAKVPIALHLDHGDTFETVCRCLKAGYTSIMIDGSHLPLQENIDLVQRVVQAAHAVQIPVEAELGTISGVEDDLFVDESESEYTNPEIAEEFVRQTGVDTLAPAFGTAHGMYKREPNLRFELLEELTQRINIPLVMHGASGISMESLQKSLSYGISKVNFSTELKHIFADHLYAFLCENRSEKDPRKYYEPAKLAVKQLVMDKIAALQC